MSRAPTINTPVIPDAGGLPYQHLDIPISQTARAAAETLGTAGSTLMDYAVKQQNLVDESTANDALTNYRTSAMSAWDQYGRLQGKHAVDEFGNYSQTLKQQLDQTISGLTPRQQRLAKASLKGVYFNMLGAGQRHNSQQDKIYSDQAADGALASLAQQAVMYRGDPNRLGATVDQAVNQVHLKGEVNGWAPETLDAAVMSTKSLIVGNVVNTLLSEDPNKAQAVFKQYQNQLDGPTQARLSEAIRNKTLAVNGAQIASGYIAPYTGPASDPGMTYSNMLRWESNNRQFDENGQPITSKAGAIGIAQLMPDTAKTVAAQHGIAFDPEKLKTDEAYNKRLGQLYFHDLLDQFGGNQMLAVAAYNAGPGAVNGWIAKYGDPRTGQISNADFAAKIPYAETKTYVGRVMGGKYDQNAGELNDQTLGKMLIDARQKYGNDPQLLASIDANLRSQFIEQKSQRQGEDAQYLDAFRNEAAFLSTGQELPEPSKFTEQSMISRFGPERGTQLWDSYRQAQEIGEARRIVKSGSIADVTNYVSGLQTQLQSDPANAAVNARKLAAAQEALKARNAAITADAAQYGLANDPTVKAAHDALSANYSPEGWQAYQTAQQTYQTHLGVPPGMQKILSDQERAQIIDHAMNLPDPKDVAQFIRGFRAQTGEAWPQVYKELTSGSGALPKQYQNLALIADGDKVSMTYLADALKMEKEKPGVLRNSLKKDEKNTDAQTIDTAVENGMLNYSLTFSPAAGGILAAQNVQEGAKLLAYEYARNGMSPADAATRAVNAFVSRYDLSVSPGSFVARSPVGMGSKMEDIASRRRFNLQIDELRPVTDLYTPAGVHTQDDINRRTLAEARQGYWITNGSSTGWQLIGLSGNPVVGADGKPVELLFQDVKGGKYDKIPAASIAPDNISPTGEVLR